MFLQYLTEKKHLSDYPIHMDEQTKYTREGLRGVTENKTSQGFRKNTNMKEHKKYLSNGHMFQVEQPNDVRLAK